MKKAVSAPGVTMNRFIVQQYAKQIPIPLQVSVDCATAFLEEFVEKVDLVVEMVLKRGRSRRDYVVKLLEVMSSIVPGVAANKFYFVAQHIIATLALSYPENHFG